MRPKIIIIGKNFLAGSIESIEGSRKAVMDISQNPVNKFVIRFLQIPRFLSCFGCFSEKKFFSIFSQKRGFSAVLAIFLKKKIFLAWVLRRSFNGPARVLDDPSQKKNFFSIFSQKRGFSAVLAVFLKKKIFFGLGPSKVSGRGQSRLSSTFLQKSMKNIDFDQKELKIIEQNFA
jgi:hypothetical protein